MKSFLGRTYEAHNAVESLQELYKKTLELTPNEMNSQIFGLDSYAGSLSLKTLVDNKMISTETKKRLAHCGMGLKQLKVVYQRAIAKNEDGISALFKAPHGSKKGPQITNSVKIIDKVNKHLAAIVRLDGSK